MNHETLLVKAVNFEECDIVSSLVQDSILHISFHSFHEDRKCLRLMLNRFCWEAVGSFDREKCYYRVHSGLYIHNVDSIVVNSGIKEHKYLNMLAFHSSPREINLIFSGNNHMCINVSDTLIYLKDLHERHPTLSLPVHE